MPWKKFLLEGDAAELTDTAPADTSHSAAQVGTSEEAARADHKHSLDAAGVGDLAALDGAAAAGSSDKVARADHKHALGPLAENLDFNKNQALQLVLHIAAEEPGSPAPGQVYFDSGDERPFVFIED
jgi:hypothetical protein